MISDPAPSPVGTLLRADRVVTAEVVHEPGWVAHADGLVTAVGGGEPPRPADLDLGPVTLAPGFVDVHAHGALGASYNDGPETAATVAAWHLRHGVTSQVASLVTASLTDLERTTAGLADLVDDGLLAGVHLEGPWLNPRRAGAHPVPLLRDPDPVDVERLLRAGRGRVVMVTVAPELADGPDAVRRIVGHGAIAAVGHTEASYEQAWGAIEAGARAATHLFNAMPGPRGRAPGPAPAFVESEVAAIELIADGIHLHPAMLRHGFTARRPILVSDAMASGLASGEHRVGSLDVVVDDEAVRFADGTIAGSMLGLDAAVRYAVSVGIDLLTAVRAATLTPAETLGRHDIGALTVGRRADLVVLDADLSVAGVLRAGEWAHRPQRVVAGA